MTRSNAARLPRPRLTVVPPMPVRPERRTIARLPVAHRLAEPQQLPLGLSVTLHLIPGGAATPEPDVPVMAERRAA